MKGICAYSISGGYGPISRYLYYTLLLISMIFHRIEWLVAGTLGASMLFSSVAAIHAIALAATRGRPTVDLDVIPVFAITGVGLVVASPTMIWSKTIGLAKASIRMILCLWSLLMFVGVLASMATLKAIPKPVSCPNDLQSLACKSLCNVTLPIRRGQALDFVSCTWRSRLFDFSGWYICVGTLFSFLGVILGINPYTPKEQAMAMYHNKTMPELLREKMGAWLVYWAYLAPWACGALIITNIVLTELIMMKPQHVPHSEDLSAIGQWAPLVAASLAFLASLLKAYMDSSSKATEVHADIESPLQPDPESIFRFELPIVFKEWTFWGHAVNGLRIVHQGVEWVVREGHLQRPAEANKQELAEEEKVMPSRRNTF